MDPSVALSLAAHNSLGSNHIFQFGTEAQRRRYMPKLTSRRVARGLGPDRGGGGLGLGRHEDDGRPGRRLLGPQRLEELHHERLGRRGGRPDGRHRPRRGAIAASRPSSSSSTTRASASARRKTSSACAPPTPARSSWRTAAFPPARLLGAEGAGWVDSMKILDGGRISIAALSVGLARGAYEAALRYSKERRQFGRADQRVRGDPVLPGRDGDRDRRGAAPDRARGGGQGRGASR